MLKRIVIYLILAIATSFDALAFSVPKKSEIVVGCHRFAAEKRLQSKLLDDIEGIWHYPDERLTLVVERIIDSPMATYRMAVVDSDNKALDRGLVVGYIQTTAQKNRLRLWLYSLSDDELLSHPVECIADIDKDGYIRIHKKKLKFRVSVNLSRFLPSVFGGVRIYPYIHDNESVNPGMVKIWPKNEAENVMIF